MFAYSPAALLLVALSVLAEASSDTCYLRIDDQIRVKHDWFACSGTSKTPSGASLCCQDGDMCGPDMICRTPDVKEGNEWYVGGCTDKAYNDPVCTQDCTSYKQTWITYNTTNQNFWNCCGDFDCADGPPTSIRFEAVSPKDWKEIPQSGSDSGSGLSSDAKIGIGVGVAVVVVAIIGLVVGWLFFMKRRTKTSAYGRSAKRSYAQVRDPGGDVQMNVPFVGENQPYSRPSSPMPSQGAYHDQPSNQPYQPPRD